MLSTRSDEALFEAVCRGDLRAFDELYARHAKALFTFVRRMIHDAHESEDVLNECFLTLVRQRESSERASNVRAWLFVVARNLCRNRLRAQKRGARSVAEITAIEAIDGGGNEPDPSALLEAKTDAEQLRRAVARLPEPMATLYALRARGMAYDEIALVLEVPVGTVKSRMHELVRRLREEMSR